MRKSLLLFAAAAMIAAACSQKSVEGEIEIPLPDNDCDAEGFVNAIKSIEVINLQVDSNSFRISDADLRVTPNYYYFLTIPRGPWGIKGYWLMCYEKKSGKLQFSRDLQGRSRAECTYPCSSFVLGDTIVINDCGMLKMYNHNGKFCGVIGDSKSNGVVLPLGNGYVCCDKEGNNNYSPDKCITLLDSAFNLADSYFAIPETYKPVARINKNSNVYVINDTLRFMYHHIFRLHSFPDDKTYHFAATNPMPESELKNCGNTDTQASIEFTLRVVNNGYASSFEDLVENQDYMFFKYSMNRMSYYVLLSKCDNKVRCIKSKRDKIGTPIDVWAVMLSSKFLYSDGRYFYFKTQPASGAFNFLNTSKDILDTKQRAVLDTMQARMAQTEEQDFPLFFKIEF